MPVLLLDILLTSEIEAVPNVTGKESIGLKNEHAHARSLQPGLFLIIDIGELLPVSVTNDVVVGLEFSGPGRREVARLLV